MNSKDSDRSCPEAWLVANLVAGRAGPKWDRYVPDFRDWQEFASALGFVVMPAKPAEFLRFLATRAESDAGYSQTKMRICASMPLASWRGSGRVDGPYDRGFPSRHPPDEARHSGPGTPDVLQRDPGPGDDLTRSSGPITIVYLILLSCDQSHCLITNS